jgi:hypothetical protein
LWDTDKALLQGTFITPNTYIRKEGRNWINDLTKVPTKFNVERRITSTCGSEKLDICRKKKK